MAERWPIRLTAWAELLTSMVRRIARSHRRAALHRRGAEDFWLANERLGAIAAMDAGYKSKWR